MWSVLYAVLLWHEGPLGVMKSLVTGGAAAQMYFLFVYAQLVVLTPLLYRGLKACRALVYAVTPVALIAYELATLAGYPLPVLHRLFPMWMLFYVVGLDWPRWKKLVEGKFGTCLALWAGCLCLQLVEGFCWNAFGDYNMATTQLKVTSMLSSLAAIAVLMALPGRARAWASGSVLAGLGDVSFGVYLCHIAVLAVVGKVLGLLALPVALATFLKWGLTLGLSCAFCVVASKVLPRRVAGWIGC